MAAEPAHRRLAGRLFLVSFANSDVGASPLRVARTVASGPLYSCGKGISTMLVLSRKRGEQIVFPCEQVRITVVEIRGERLAVVALALRVD